MKISKDKTCFVVLSSARSGTSLLTGTLNSHPEIMCHGEIFHKSPTIHLRGDFSGMSDKEINELRGDETKFVSRVFDQEGCNIVGFKMWREQNREFCASILSDERVSKIIYERDNKLAQYSSNILGRVDKRDSPGAVIVIQAGICNGDQRGTKPDVERRVGVL